MFMEASADTHSDPLPQALFIHMDAFGSGLVLESSLCMPARILRKLVDLSSLDSNQREAWLS